MEASGLAGRLRQANDSDQYDLSGYSKEQCVQLAKDAFTEPLPLSSMVRLSFVVGGGKLCRQKYSDDLPKDLCTALGAIGYQDDKAASCEMSSAGSYKFQHDTSKNLKFVHVFPRVAPPEQEGDGGEGEEGGGAAKGPADVLAESEMDEFRRMVAAHVTGYGPKRRLLEELKERLSRLEAAERKLIAREQLESSEQELYDTLTADGLKAKILALTKELQQMVDEGQLTSAEKAQVLEQLDDKLTSLEADLKKATDEGKAKLQAKLEEGKEKLKQTRKTVADHGSRPLLPLKHGKEVGQLHLKLQRLKRLEKESSGKYTMDELKRLGEMPELEEAISVLIERSRTWFEDDDTFNQRVQVCKREAVPAKAAAPRPAPASSGGYGGGGGGGFTTVGGKKKR